MKKLLFSIMMLIATVSYGQLQLWSGETFIVEFDMSTTITGTDTILYRNIELYEGQNLKTRGGGMAVEVIYGGLNADDATIDIGISLLGNTFNTIDDTTLPYTLDATGNAADVNGAAPGKTGGSKASDIWIRDELPRNFWIGIKINKGSVTSGTLYIYIAQ
jgi:hypothetical protein